MEEVEWNKKWSPLFPCCPKTSVFVKENPDRKKINKYISSCDKRSMNNSKSKVCWVNQLRLASSSLNRWKAKYYWFIFPTNNNKIIFLMMMMMNCFCGMVDRRVALSLISSRDHCQRSSPSRISDTPGAVFEPTQNLSSGLVEWSCAVVITTTPRCHNFLIKML